MAASVADAYVEGTIGSREVWVLIDDEAHLSRGSGLAAFDFRPISNQNGIGAV